LRTLNVPEHALRDLWHLEKKLRELLHVDTGSSPTWFLDACGQTTQPRRRLLLTNSGIGVELPSRMLQLGLQFEFKLTELFKGNAMGEDALRVFYNYLKSLKSLQQGIVAELPQVRAAAASGRSWVKRT